MHKEHRAMQYPSKQHHINGRFTHNHWQETNIKHVMFSQLQLSPWCFGQGRMHIYINFTSLESSWKHIYCGEWAKVAHNHLTEQRGPVHWAVHFLFYYFSYSDSSDFCNQWNNKVLCSNGGGLNIQHAFFFLEIIFYPSMSECLLLRHVNWGGRLSALWAVNYRWQWRGSSLYCSQQDGFAGPHQYSVLWLREK